MTKQDVLEEIIKTYTIGDRKMKPYDIKEKNLNTWSLTVSASRRANIIEKLNKHDAVSEALPARPDRGQDGIVLYINQRAEEPDREELRALIKSIAGDHAGAADTLESAPKILCASCLLKDNKEVEAVALVSSTIYADHAGLSDKRGLHNDTEIFYPVCREFLKEVRVDNKTVFLIKPIDPYEE